MIAIDTNLLIYAHRRGTPEHKAAQRAIEKAASHRSGWGFSMPTLSEFWAVVTHPSCVGGPSSATDASAFLQSLLQTGSGQLWNPREGFSKLFLKLAVDMDLKGTRIFDLQIAVIALQNGASELWTHDTQFVSIPGLRVRDPLSKGA